MPAIVEHRPHNVTIGVMDKSLKLYEELQSVTFADVFGTLHTVFAHVNGPFTTPEEIVRAFFDGVLHTHESHAAAAQLARDKGETDFANKLDKLGGTDTPPGGQSGERGL
jgi:hypothetical protein